MNKKFSVACRMAATMCLVCIAVSAKAQSDGSDLYISYTDSVEVSLDLVHLRSLEFSYSGRQMFANYRDGSSRTHDYSRIGKLYFDAVANGIEIVMPEERGALFTLAGTLLTLHSEASGAALYNMNGLLVKMFTGKEVSIDGLPSGVYVLRVDNQTTKICIP